MHTSRGEASFPPFLRTHVPFHACPSAKRKEEEKKSPYTQHSFPHSPPPSPHILCLFLLTWAPSRKKGVLPQTSTTPVFSPTAAFFFPFFSLSPSPPLTIDQNGSCQAKKWRLRGLRTWKTNSVWYGAIRAHCPMYFSSYFSSSLSNTTLIKKGGGERGKHLFSIFPLMAKAPKWDGGDAEQYLRR